VKQVADEMPSGTYAKVIADSIYDGSRLTTFEVRFHRFVLAEMNTHCVFARNSASSRAIPAMKQINKVRESPAFPVEWPHEQKGMQGGDLITEDAEMAEVQEVWRDARDAATDYAEKLVGMRLHKSLANRLIEPFMWHTAVITATSWQNFFDQRCSPLAMPEIRVAAEAMRSVYEHSDPVELTLGEYHMPYLAIDDYTAELTTQELVQISAARCARVSYLTQNGKRDVAEDLEMYQRLVSADPMHASPLEHVATPAPWNHQTVQIQAIVEGVEGQQMWGVLGQRKLPKIGKFMGWLQHRHEYECRAGHTSYR
jgi:hypothetical protein